MSGPDDTDCAPLFHNLGLAFGGQPAPAQKVFRVSKTEAQASRGKSQVYAWDLPRGFPAPVAPADNPMSEAKVELGRYLFYDNNLSLNHSQSCASCHKQEMAFTDGLAQPVGSTGEIHPRSSMSLANMAYNPTLTWANHNLRSLENQALVPMFGETPVELGLAGKEGELLARLRAEPVYQKLFPRAFPAEKDPFTIANTTRGLASFVRSLISGNAPYDRYRYGDENAISPAAKRGELLFASERLECFHCHGGLNFSGPVVYQGKTLREAEFHNTGLYNLDGKGAYPADNTGLYELTQRPADMGRFKAPTLRNIALTAPYMHDGSVKTLDEVIDHYAAGGRAAAGNSGPSPLKSAFVKGFTLTRRERADLLAFLHSLTDEQFIRNPRFANPWTKRSDAK
jgi:cytochrome c peroxidase